MSQKGLTLPELLIATLIFTVAFAGILLGILSCMELSEMTQHSTAALYASKSRIAAIENTPFAQISANYNNTTFTAPDVNGIGVVNINSPSADTWDVTVTFCWRQTTGRIIGEDTNLNGQLNAGEDQNGNGILDSPVKLTTSVYDTTG